MSEDVSNDSGANLASLVHHAVSTSNDYVVNFDRMLENPSDNFLLPREVMLAIRTLLWTDSALLANLYEENQQIFDLMKNVESKITK